VSDVKDTQDNIVAALKLVSALSGADVSTAVSMHECFPLNLTRKPTVYVVYAGFRREGQQLVGNHGAVTGGKYIWQLVAVVDDRSAPAAAQTKTLGAFALAEAVRGIRGTNIAPTGKPPRYLVLVAETLTLPVDRPPQGGPVGYVCEYETSWLMA